MTARIIILPVVPKPPLSTALSVTQAPTLSPRHRRRLKSLATELGVSQETAVVMIIAMHFDAEGGK